MKKLTILLALLLVAAMLCACGAAPVQDTEETGETGETGETEELTEYIPVEYPSTTEIMTDLHELEMEITRGLKELEEMING